jgi:hypothetical protein
LYHHCASQNENDSHKIINPTTTTTTTKRKRYRGITMTWYLFYQAFKKGTQDKLVGMGRRGGTTMQQQTQRSVSTQAAAVTPEQGLEGLTLAEWDDLIIDVSDKQSRVLNETFLYYFPLP